ncbi:hypothetical protein TNCV_4119481 [Trichonephila clavipes]|nr:hypothetical protein TNCV_4119481 [Trichonephila clavipes]
MNCPTLLWSARSPNLSQIEHVQDMKGRRLHLTAHVHDRARQLKKICQEIPQETTKVIYHCIERSVTACIQARGFLWFRIIKKYHSVEFSAKRGRLSAGHQPSCLTEGYFVDSIHSTEDKTNPTQHRILLAAQRVTVKVGRKTGLYSPDCDVGLCAITCFRIYHSRSNFDE